jgi:hypothetical protein
MIDILSDLTEVPFDVFWDKWHEVKEGSFNRSKAEQVWFYMAEPDRIDAFEALAKNSPIVEICHEPYLYLKRFRQ